MSINVDKVRAFTNNQILTDYAVKGWIIYIQRYFTPRTVQQYEMVIKHFCRIAPNQLLNITTDSIEQYLDRVLKNYTPTTGNAHLTAIKSFYHWASDRFQFNNPTKGMKKFVENPPHQRVLSEEEYQVVLFIAKNTDQDVIQFLGNTGLRKSEFQSLTPQNITKDLRLLWVFGKGRKQRVIPLNNG